MPQDPGPRLCRRGLHDLADPANVRPSGFGCRPCQTEARRVYSAANAEKVRAQKRAEYAAHAETYRARSRAWYYAHKERALADARRRVLAEPEKVAERQSAYRASHRSELAEAKKVDHAKHLERDRERSRVWYEENKQKAAASAREWQVANPDRVAAIMHRRRVRKAGGVHVKYTIEQTSALIARYHGLCAYCRTRAATELDHMIPIVLGGPDALINLLPVCHVCNTSKGARTPAAWLLATSRRPKARARTG